MDRCNLLYINANGTMMKEGERKKLIDKILAQIYNKTYRFDRKRVMICGCKVSVVYSIRRYTDVNTVFKNRNIAWKRSNE